MPTMLLHWFHEASGLFIGLITGDISVQVKHQDRMLATYHHLMPRLQTVLCLYLDIRHSKAVRHVYNFEVYLHYTNISVIKH